MHTPHIDHAFEHVKASCEKSLKQHFPISIPKTASDRLEKELAFLKQSEYLDDFEIFRVISEEAKKSNNFFSVRGTLAGSYLVYLLRDTLTDPLPPYYYCPECGHFELVETHLFGIDLPKAQCPECQSTMISNGYNLSIESVWGIDGKKMQSFEYNINHELITFVHCALQKLYPNNEIAPLGLLMKHMNNPQAVMAHCGFLILPDSLTMDDYPDIQGYLEDGEPCLNVNYPDLAKYNLRRVFLLQNPIIETLVSMQRKTGFYISEITGEDISAMAWNQILNTGMLNSFTRNLFSMLKPVNFTAITSILLSCHNTFKDIPFTDDGTACDELYQFLQSPEFLECPCYSREDFFDRALDAGFSRELAFEISEFIRKGKAASNNATFQQKFEDYQLPDSMKKMAQKCLYLFPRAHDIEYMINYAQLAFYRKKNNRAYSSLIAKYPAFN